MIAEIILATVLGWLIISNVRRLLRLPPGPVGLPIVGYMPFLSYQPYDQFSRLADKYGDIMSLQVGNYRVPVVSSLEIIREMFKEGVFSGRTDMHIMASKQHAKLGLLLSDGQRWQDLRRFSLRNLRDLGFGKWSQENLIIDEIDQLSKTIMKDLGKPVTLLDRININVVNALWSILTGETFDSEDTECVQMIHNMNRLLSGATATDPVFLLPILNYFGKFKRKSQEMQRNASTVMSLAKKLIRQHQESHNGDRSDFMHIFMDQVQKYGHDPESTFNEKGAEDTLAMILVDLFIAGNETTSTALLWFFLLMVAHPHIQQKVQQEIDSVVSDGTGPLLEHRNKLPYTEAVLMETLRFGSVLPMSLRHRVIQDTHFRGYFLPEGSILFGNLYKVMRNPEHWAKPHEFHPEHFLNSDGTFKLVEAFIPFGIGKRICLGESLARLQFYLFAVRLIYQFEFRLPDDQLADLSANNGLIRAPKPYSVIITQRK